MKTVVPVAQLGSLGLYHMQMMTGHNYDGSTKHRSRKELLHAEVQSAQHLEAFSYSDSPSQQ